MLLRRICALSGEAQTLKYLPCTLFLKCNEQHPSVPSLSLYTKSYDENLFIPQTLKMELGENCNFVRRTGPPQCVLYEKTDNPDCSTQSDLLKVKGKYVGKSLPSETADATSNCKEDLNCSEEIEEDAIQDEQQNQDSQCNKKVPVLPTIELKKVADYISKHPEVVASSSDCVDSRDSLHTVPDFLKCVSQVYEFDKQKSRKRKRNHVDDKTERKVHKKDQPSKKRPNYFISIPIDNPVVSKQLQIVQQHILQQEPPLKQAVIDLRTLHLTLFVLTLENEDDVIRAKSAFDSCAACIESLLEKDVVVKVSGLDHFKQGVLFASLEKNEALDKVHTLAEKVTTVFTEKGLPPSDAKGFKPHATIIKLSKMKTKKNKGVKKIDPALYRKYRFCVFGAQPVREIQLCSMMKPKQEGGYYHVEHSVKTVSNSAGDLALETCDLSCTPEKHVCIPAPVPGKVFKEELIPELKWTFQLNE